MDNTILKLVKSWNDVEGKIKSFPEILDWIKMLNATTYVEVKECSINDNTFWFYDDYNGEVLNRKRGFFSIKGMRLFRIVFRYRRLFKLQKVILQEYMEGNCHSIFNILRMHQNIILYMIKYNQNNQVVFIKNGIEIL